jgi:outer membrane usher protein FimD/PapC
VRLLTFLRTDSRETLMTLILGDLTATSGVLGTSPLLGGVSLSKNFSIDPYFIRFPSLTFSGTLLSPSEVEVYIDDVLVRQQRLLPGNFLLTDVPANIGLGTAEIVVTDAFGQRRVISRPFFFSDRLLKKGLHEFSYSLGFLREELGVDNFSYGRAAFLAFHNYGFTDRLKAGYTLEASDSLLRLGPTVSFLVGNAGVLDSAFSLSVSDGKSGFGGFLGYFFRSRYVNAALSVNSFSQNFSNIAISPSDDKPSFQLTGTIGFTTRTLGSVSAEYSTTRLHIGEDASRYALNYNRVITSWATFFITASRTEFEDTDDVDELFAGLHIYFGHDTSGSLTYTDREGESVKTATARKSLPVGTGIGFRAQAVDFEETTDILGDFEYQNDYGIYGIGYRDIGEKESYLVSASGGIGYIGSAFLSRPITDGFAKVKVGGLEGVRAYYFGNEVGTTDSKGEVIVPVMRSFIDNRIDIEKDDIPVEYSIPALTKYINPPFKGGSLISFGVSKVQALIGNVYTMVEGEKRPVEFSEMLITVEDRTIEGLVGRGGEFYAENVPSGKYPAKVFYDGKQCIFDIIVPESEEVWLNLGEVVCEVKEDE